MKNCTTATTADGRTTTPQAELEKRLESLGSYREFYQQLPCQIVVPPKRGGKAKSGSTTTYSSYFSIPPPPKTPPPKTPPPPMKKKGHQSSSTPMTVASSTMNSPSCCSSTPSPGLLGGDKNNNNVDDVRLLLPPPLVSISRNTAEEQVMMIPKAISVRSSSPSTFLSYSEESCEHIHVAVRLHPTQTKPSLSPVPSSHHAYDHPKNVQLMDESVTDADMYKRLVRPVVANMLSQGNNGTVILYGPYSRHNLHGNNAATSHLQREPGIAAMAVFDLFNKKNPLADQIKVQYTEVIDGDVWDLLADSNNNNNNRSGDLTSVEVESVQQALLLLDRGDRRRTRGATAVLRLELEHISPSDCHPVVLHVTDVGNNEHELVSLVQQQQPPSPSKPSSVYDSTLIKVLEPNWKNSSSNNSNTAVLCCVPADEPVVEATLKLATSIVSYFTETQGVINPFEDSLRVMQLEEELAAAKKALKELQQQRRSRSTKELADEQVSAASTGAVVCYDDALGSIRCASSAHEKPPPLAEIIFKTQHITTSATQDDTAPVRTGLDENEQSAEDYELRLVASEVDVPCMLDSRMIQDEKTQHSDELASKNRKAASIEGRKILLPQHSSLLFAALYFGIGQLATDDAEYYYCLAGGFMWIALEVITN